MSVSWHSAEAAPVDGVPAVLTVRYFAAARAAAGVETALLRVAPGTTVATLIDRLGDGNDDLARVLRRCSFLCDGVAVRDRAMRLESRHEIDVLPPFAGG